MTEEARQAFAARLVREVEVRFRGVAIRAYTAAGVNSATWSRAVNGLSIKPHTQREIVANLWPETRGDWTLIPEEPVELNTAEQMRELARRVRELERENQRLRALGESDAG